LARIKKSLLVREIGVIREIGEIKVIVGVWLLTSNLSLLAAGLVISLDIRLLKKFG
jgi:hypothetical protein